MALLHHLYTTERKSVNRQKRGTVSQREVEEAVAEFYIGSRDFNGIPEGTLKQQLGERYSREHVKALVRQGLVHLVSERVFANPHVYLLPNVSTDKQIEILESGPGLFCLYPTAKALRGRVDSREYTDRPYTALLARGAPQLMAITFDLSVLEPYFNDPRYTYHNDDITGGISVSDEYYESPEMKSSDQFIVQSFAAC